MARKTYCIPTILSAYSKPVEIPIDASTMKVVTYRGDKQVGRLIVFPIAEMKKRAGVKDKM